MKEVGSVEDCRDLLFCARVIMLVNVSSFHGLVGTR